MAGNTFFGNIGRSGQPVALFAGYQPSFRVVKPGMSGFTTAMRGFAGPQIGRSGFGDTQSFYNGMPIDDPNGGMSTQPGGSDTGTSITDIVTAATGAAKTALGVYGAVTGSAGPVMQTAAKPMSARPYSPPKTSWVVPAIVAVGIGAGVVWYMKKKR